MDRKIAGLLGAAAALGTVTSAQAAVPPADQFAPAGSYRELLDPIAHALPLLRAENGRTAANPSLQLAKTIVIKKKHHHHHHHHHHHPHHS